VKFRNGKADDILISRLKVSANGDVETALWSSTVREESGQAKPTMVDFAIQ
jgi:hypothetical protein